MDHQQQTNQTEKIIVEMLEFLATSSDEDNDLEKETTGKCDEDMSSTNKDVNDKILTKNMKNNTNSKHHVKKHEKPVSSIAKELIKLKQQFQWKTNEMDTLDSSQQKPDPLNCSKKCTVKSQAEDNFHVSSDFDSFDWQYKLENYWRHSCSNSYTQEIYKAVYQDTTGHPPSGSADYYQAAQNYVIYGKNFLDFPENIQILLNDKNLQNAVTENSNLISNIGSSLYTKPATCSVTVPPTVALTTAAASAAAYYQICNSIQAQARPTISTNPGNSTAYGIVLGNKMTYVAGTPTTPSLIYNQHSTTTTNFISNSLANAALSTSPTILYTNPMLTTTTQQYLTQFLSTAALTANSLQSATASNNGAGVGVYERLIYAQMLQQQLYQTQQAAAVAAMFQHKQRVAAIAAAARQASNAMIANTSKSSAQHLVSTPAACSTSALTLTTCNRQARTSSPSELLGLKPQSSGPIAVAETNEYSKSATD